MRHRETSLSPPYFWGRVSESLTKRVTLKRSRAAKMPKLKLSLYFDQNQLDRKAFSCLIPNGKFMRNKQLQLNKHLQASGYPGRGKKKKTKPDSKY